MENNRASSKKLKIELPYNPAISLLGIYPKELKSGSGSIILFFAALFTIAKRWKQPKCLLTDEWIKKMWYIHKMEYYSASTKKEILLFETTRTNLEDIMLSKISQSQKDRCYIVLLM